MPARKDFEGYNAEEDAEPSPDVGGEVGAPSESEMIQDWIAKAREQQQQRDKDKDDQSEAA